MDNQLYENLLNSYLDPQIEPIDNISLPRHGNRIIDSKIVNINIVSLISKWIEKLDVDSKFSHLRELYLPYKFELLLRGSRDGFTPKTFHRLCDDKPVTVTFIKVKGTEEILGGYNPSVWKSTGYSIQTKGSFIFSFKNENNLIKDAILSNVNKTIGRTLNYDEVLGPCFSQDLCIYSSNETKDFDHAYCKQDGYEEKIRNTEDSFSIEDYEVFQVIISSSSSNRSSPSFPWSQTKTSSSPSTTQQEKEKEIHVHQIIQEIQKRQQQKKDLEQQIMKNENKLVRLSKEKYQIDKIENRLCKELIMLKKEHDELCEELNRLQQ